MKKLLTTACLFIVTTIAIVSFMAATVTAKVDLSSAKSLTARVDKLFAQWNQSDLPGCALGIVKDGQLIYKRGYGMANPDYNIPISPKPIFDIQSISKQFTAMSILLLAKQKKVSLNNNIQKYLPEVPRYQSPIPIRHFIHDTSGIRDSASKAAMDRDLMEVTISKLQSMYASKKYTVTQVTQWYLDRIARYDRVYKAVLHVDIAGAMATASAQDAAAKKGGKDFKRSPLWGVPIVIKANTSVKGLVTSVGWNGYLIPGHELIAPEDATVVAKLRAAGAVIVGQTNMPDFAESDTNLSSAFGRTGNAYDWRFSPGGSSGGTVTSVTGNFAVFGTGTDTGNSIRMPSGTSAVVGLLPTRGLVSIAGIHPLDWLRDNTGPIARNVTDAAIALDVMAGEDPKDVRTKGSISKAQPGPYTKYLKADALKGKRFGVPAFIVKEAGPGLLLSPETREIFMKAIEGLKAAGATVVFDNSILPDSFTALVGAVKTRAYLREGIDSFLCYFGPLEYRSAADFQKVVGTPLPTFIIGGGGRSPVAQRVLESDPESETYFWAPQRKALAAYEEALDRLHLDGFVYPALQMPPNDETIPQPDGRPSSGPHSNTGWVNPIGVPAVVVPGGFYANGLPFGLELSARPWKDGDLLGWAFAYEQATKHRKPPVLVIRQVNAFTPSNTELRAFEGEYVSPELNTTSTLVARDSSLVIQIRGWVDLVLWPVFADAFQGARVGIVNFSRDARGVVTEFTVNTSGVRNLRFDRVKR